MDQYTSPLTILAVAGIDLEGLLLGEYINLDATVRTRQCRNRSLFSPIIRTKLISIDDIARIVARTVCSAIVNKLGSSEVGTDLLGGRPIVIDRVLLIWENNAVRNQDAVCRDALTGIGEVECVIEGCGCFGVTKAVQIPVRMRAEHNGRLFRQSECDHFEMPLVRRQRIRNVRDHISRKALIAVMIEQGESNGISRVGDDCPVAPIPAIDSVLLVTLRRVRALPAIGTSVKCVESTILVCADIIRIAINSKGRILDSVGITTWQFVSADC